jgi:23S rRNA (uracil1939-C5)-methyltransferase
MPVHPGQQLRLKIDALAFGGAGVARREGMVLFVERGLPGQIVEAKVTRVKKRHAFARVLEVVERSSFEMDPGCPHFDQCGGCAFRDLDYAAQLQWKRVHAEDALSRLAGIRDVEVRPVLPSPQLQGFRNKMEFSFQDRQDGGVTIGLHKRSSGRAVMEVPHCQLPPPETMAALATASDAAKNLSGSTFDPEARRGFWRRLIIRQSQGTKRIMVHLITTNLPRFFPEAKKLLEAIRSAHPQVSSCVHSTRNNAKDIALGEHEVLHLGEHFLEERLAGYRLRITPNAFFQTNTLGAEVLCKALLDAADFNGSETVYDLYCGVGALTLPLARAVRQAAGVEILENAVLAARENADLNNIRNCPFLAVDLKDARRAFSQLPPPDAVIADPPRAGMHENLLRELLTERPRTILYVSCNPPTMARDLKPLLDAYRLHSAQPVDLFPHSPHVEIVVKLQLAD